LSSRNLPLPKILWVEDGARYELSEVYATVSYSGSCTLKLAPDATTAINLLARVPFDAAIIDVRLPPGGDPAWVELYNKAGRDKITAQLGLRILEWLCCPDCDIRRKIKETPRPVPACRIGIFTIESRESIKSELDKYKIEVYERKTTSTPDTVLLDLIGLLLNKLPAGGI
jgi:hypothetical protein